MLNYEWIVQQRKQILLIFASVLLLLILQLWSGHREQRYYVGDPRELTAVQREDLATTQSIPLVLEVEVNGKVETFDVLVSFTRSIREEELQDSTSNVSTDNLQASINQVLTSLEAEDKQVIPLPKQLGDGTKINWKKPSAAQDYLLLLLFPLSVCLWFRYQQEQIRMQETRRQECIRRSLPAFNDQLILLLHSGLIFHDAFSRIADNCRGRENQHDFDLIILHLADAVESTGKSIVAVMEESKAIVGSREYSRLVNILSDHQIKGVDLQEKLESESRLLWEGRKAQSLQRGKEMETKLTFPLAVLLLVVVMIAGVPAIMTM